MDSKRSLIVNADDFGLSEGVNRGIIEAYERGIVTSASLMVLKPAAARAAAYGREHLRFGLGLHLDLGEWAYNGEDWILVDRIVPLDDRAVVAEELERQLRDFRRLVGRDPTHLDSHQHVHLDEPVRSAALEIARRLDVPLRHLSAGIQYCGRFYGQTARGLPLADAISVESLIAILTDLPPGLTELGCHPGRGIGTESSYASERSTEVDVLSNDRVRTHLGAEGIDLLSFGDLIHHRT
jgi:chitin disaccharide deacetylase